MTGRTALVVSLVALMVIAGQAFANVPSEFVLWTVQQERTTPGFEPFRWAKLSSGELAMWYGGRSMPGTPMGEWTIFTYSDAERGEMAAVKCRELPGRKIDVEWARAVKLSKTEYAA